MRSEVQPWAACSALVSGRVTITLDWTGSKLYTLSEKSENVLRDLEQEVEILIPAALENQIGDWNASDVKAKIVAELAEIGLHKALESIRADCAQLKIDYDNWFSERTLYDPEASGSATSLFDQYVKLNKKVPPEILTSLSGIDEPGRLADTPGQGNGASRSAARTPSIPPTPSTAATPPRSPTRRPTA